MRIVQYKILGTEYGGISVKNKPKKEDGAPPYLCFQTLLQHLSLAIHTNMGEGN